MSRDRLRESCYVLWSRPSLNPVLPAFYLAEVPQDVKRGHDADERAGFVDHEEPVYLERHHLANEPVGRSGGGNREHGRRHDVADLGRVIPTTLSRGGVAGP